MTQLADKVLNLAQKPWQRLKKTFKAKKKAKGSVPFDFELIKEFAGLLLAALTLVMVLSLFSYDGNDHEIKVGQEGIRNWLGPAGAIIAHSLFNFFGIWAMLLPGLSLACASRLFFQRPALLSKSRTLGLSAIIVGLSPMMADLWRAMTTSNFYLSGRIGEALRANLLAEAGRPGLYILCLTLVLWGLLFIQKRPFVARSFFATLYISKWLKALALSRFKKKAVEQKSLVVMKPVLEPDFIATSRQSPKIELESHQVIEEKADIQIIERDRKAAISAVKKAEQAGDIKVFSFSLPPIKLLDYDAPSNPGIDGQHLKLEAEKLQQAFLQFGIEGKIREIRPGPVVTNYEFVPAPGIKLSRIAALSDDIAMAMSAVQVRIVTPIPGKGAVGIEVPNVRRETVYLKEIVADERYRLEPHKLCMAIGKDVEGTPYFMNLADMPHVLIAGTTGSGKSVSVNAMICSILYRATPDDVRFMFIDPKMLELSIYNGIPHLLLPPIIDAKKAGNALRWAVKEMDDRYSLMKEAVVRDIASYNERIKQEPELKPVLGRAHEHLPYLVIVVDEYADLLAVAGKEVEGYVMRLAQKARAAGIHVMLATQRPSVDVITGVIKANFPVRMGFRLASSHDSKTIINKTGAEKLLGRGDVLIMPPGTSDLFRIHGAFVSEKELIRVVEFWRAQKPPQYREEIAEFAESAGEQSGSESFDKAIQDEKYEEAIGIVRQYKRCSTSFIQRQLCIGYNRAARIVEQMEKSGMVGPVLNARGEREIFIDT